MRKEEIFEKALALNGDDKKYVITVEDDKIITRVKWMDANFFGPDFVTEEIKTFEYIVKIHDNGKYSEISKKSETSKELSADGLSYKKKIFRGKEFTFDKTIGIGKDNLTDSVGVVETTFNSEEYKKPVRELLESNGYKKKTGNAGKIIIAASLVVVLLMVAAVILILNGVAKKVAIDAETFTAQAEESGYYVGHDTFTESLRDEIESIVIAVEKEKDYQIEFYVFTENDIAYDVFTNNKSNFEKEGYTTIGNINSEKFDSVTITTEDEYKYISRIDNTVLFIVVDKEYKEEVESFVEKINY